MKFKVLIENTDEVFGCSEGQHILSAMSKMGKKGIPSGCHGGGCGVCKVKINQGAFSSKKMSRAHVSADEEKAGYALACRVFPETDITLHVIGKLQKRF
ncbi:MAG: 2Fe-2S iron-sulfur cluster-binding protein [Cycloclasticus sp.]